MRAKNYFFEQQESNDCAVACIAMICKYYKKDFSIMKIKDILGTDIKGTSVKALHHGAEEMGFEVKTVRITRDVIGENFTLPAICHVKTAEGASHFIVLSKTTDKYVKILDPAKGIIKETIDDFFEYFDGLILLLYPGYKFYNNNSFDKNNLLKNYIKLIMPQKRLFFVAFIVSIFLTLLGILFSMFNKILLDEVLPYEESKMLVWYTIGFGLVLLSRILLEAIRQHIILYLSQRLDLPLMLGYFNHVFKLPIDFFGKRKIGDVTTRFQDAFTVKDIITNTALTLIMDIIFAIASMIMLVIMSWKLFMVLFVVTILSVILIYIYKGIFKKINKMRLEQVSRVNSSIIEGLKCIETIKTNSYENTTMDKLEVQYVKSLKIFFKQGFYGNIEHSISSLITGFGNLIMMSLGVYFAIKGEITIGGVLAFFTIANYFLDPIGRLVNLQLSIEEANVSFKRLEEIYELEEEENKELCLQNVDEIHNINMRDVSFRYGKRELVLDSINLKIDRGMKVAIVGESGSGKTTLSKLLLKLYSIERGSIEFDGLDLSNINAFSLRSRIGYVPQTIELFSGSIIDNLRVGKPDATLDEIKNACRITGCEKFISKLPYGYDTFLDENGGGLSGGEKQRLALARAIVKKPKFLILDEPTSSLDLNTENEILDFIFNKQKDVSILIIAHRLSTIKNCDLIVVLSEGKIIESGKHDNLMEKNGTYSKLWNIQSGNIVFNEEKNEESLDFDEYVEYR